MGRTKIFGAGSLLLLMLCGGPARAGLDVYSFRFGGLAFGSYPEQGERVVVEDPLFTAERFHPAVTILADPLRSIRGEDWAPPSRVERYYSVDGLYRIVVPLGAGTDVGNLSANLGERYAVALRPRQGGFVYTVDQLRLEVVPELGPGVPALVFTDTTRERKVTQELAAVRAAVHRRMADRVRSYFAGGATESAAAPETTPRTPASPQTPQPGAPGSR